MTQITVTPQSTDPHAFEVHIQDADSQTTHHVTLPTEDHQRIAPDHDPDALVEASFRYLLDHEPKEAILSRFEITTINRYFPGYEDAIHAYLENGP